MAATADKFSRLAALKPARAMPARPTTLRAPDEEDALGRLLGAGVSKNRFGEHLAVRNWFSTPEFSEPSPVALELLSRTRDEALSRKMRAALSNPAKWLFLDTETRGLAGGTGTYAFLIGLPWWDAGVPPRQTDEKGVRAGAPGEACRFRVQEKPLGGI